MMKIQWNKKTLLFLCMGIFVIMSVMNNLHIIEGLTEGEEDDKIGDDGETRDGSTEENNNPMTLKAEQFGFYPDTLTKVMSIIKSYHIKVTDFLENNDLSTIDSLNENTITEIDKKKREYESWLYKLFNELNIKNKYIRRTHQVFRLNLNDCDDKTRFKSFLTAIDNYFGEDNSKLAGVVNDVYVKIKNMTIKNIETNSKKIYSNGIYGIGLNTQINEIKQKRFLKNINVLSDSMLEVLSFTGKSTLNTEQCS